MIDLETLHIIEIEIFPMIGIETIQMIDINDIKTLDHEITHKIGTQTITIDKEITLNHLIGIIHVIPILKTDIEATHQNIKDK